MKKQILLLILALLPMLANADDSGSCGTNVTYTFEEATGTLTISGTGPMYSYNYPNYYAPWTSYREDILKAIVTDGVTSIGKDAFYCCYGLTSITIPNSVTSIGEHAFSDCYLLTSVAIPNSVTSISEGAFLRCGGLTSIAIPNSVTSIGEDAFYNCIGLNSITIPNSVTSIGKNAFSSCTSMTSIAVESGNTVFDSRENCNAIIKTSTNELIAGCKNTSIPNSVTSIGSYAFYGCKGLTSVTIPNSVTIIGEYAFYNCSGLTSLTIGNSVTEIDYSAFSGCTSLTSITIPNSVTSIGNVAFSGCSGLTSITISNSVTSTGNYAFSECTGLTSINIPNSVTSIGEGAFYGCSGLTSVTIPNSVTSIGQYAFRRCTGLTSVTIPNSVTSIGEGAFSICSNITVATLPENLMIIKKELFYACSKLQSIIIPASVVYINQAAFSGTGLTSVKVLATTPPSAYNNTFSNYNIPLYAPEESISAYQSTNPWSKFASFNTLSGETIETPKCATPTISYENKELTYSCDTEGVEFVYEIKDNDIKQGNGSQVNLSAAYEISVYATKEGYENSDVATATLVWGNATFTDTTPATAISPAEEMAPVPVLIQSNGGTVTIQGAADGTPVSIYTTAGTQAGSAVSQNGRAAINTSLQAGSIAIIKIGTQSYKYVLR